jgi:hypothetical protein
MVQFYYSKIISCKYIKVIKIKCKENRKFGIKFLTDFTFGWEEGLFLIVVSTISLSRLITGRFLQSSSTICFSVLSEKRITQDFHVSDYRNKKFVSARGHLVECQLFL